MAISPLGTLGVTWLLVFLVGSGEWWANRESLELAGQTVPFGGVIYGSCIFVLEVTARMLWALAQRQKEIDKARGEGREEGIEVGRGEGREEGIEVGREEGIEVGREEGIEVGREQGIEVGRQQVIREMMERGVELPPEILKASKEPKRP